MRVLVTGGAGYIGSHTSKALQANGFEPIVLDDLRTGNRDAVQWGPLVECDLSDATVLRDIMLSYGIGAVIHFAASAYVGESMTDPRKYFQNNVIGGLNLLSATLDAGVGNIVFSSSCATYGVPTEVPIPESERQEPVNPYGDTKLLFEKALHWYSRAYGIRYAVLRYFNAAGADPDGELGEAHTPETHLIPLAIEAALGRRDALEVFGTDYPTADGTAIRDYVHVSDLADAHVAALHHSVNGLKHQVFNLGTGNGTSVLEVLDAIERVASVQVPWVARPRRAGDPPVLVADPTRAGELLNWHPRRSDIDAIVRTAWDWHRSPRRAHLLLDKAT